MHVIERSRQCNDRGGCRSIPLRRVGRAVEEGPHLGDLLRLRADDLGGKSRYPRVLGVDDVLRHVDGAFVVQDHELREEPIELRSARVSQLLQLIIGQHAGHAVHTVLAHRLVHRHDRNAPLLQPGGHLVNLRLLGPLDLSGQLLDLRARGPSFRKRRHFDRLLMVRNHHLREHRVGRRSTRGARWRHHARVVHIVRATAAGEEHAEGCRGQQSQSGTSNHSQSPSVRG